jgi:hypothetical protein
MFIRRSCGSRAAWERCPVWFAWGDDGHRLDDPRGYESRWDGLAFKDRGYLGESREIKPRYSTTPRIYGAGMRHAVLLLVQLNAGMLPDEAWKLAKNLYASTKGSERICLDASSGSEERKVIYPTTSTRLLCLIDGKLLLWGAAPSPGNPQDSVPIT